MSSRLVRIIRHYALAIAATLAALGGTLAIDPIRTKSPFLLFALGVMVAAGYGGTGPGVLATLLGAILANYFIFPPLHTFLTVPGPADLVPLLLFTGVGFLITWLQYLLRRNQDRLRQAHEQLVRATSITTSIIDGTSDAIAAVDTQFRFLAFNYTYARQFEVLFGASVELGASVLDRLSSPDYRERASAQWNRALSGEQFTVMETLEDVHGVHSYEIAFNPMRNQSGQVTGASQVVRDTTARLQLEEQLRQAQKMEAIGQLAGGVAHDFNNLLTVISGYLEFVLSGLLHGDPVREPLSEASLAAARAAALTRQLLAFSRRQSVQPTVFDLNTAIRQVEKMLRRLIGEDIHLALALNPDLPQIEADMAQVEQVIMNLAVNARDAMPDGGRLVIATSSVSIAGNETPQIPTGVEPGRYIRLTVTDTGIGIPPAVQPRIFEPFFTTKAKGKGTGLGLSTVYGIVRQCGGFIHLESQPGNGATFTVLFPATTSAAAAEESPAPAAMTASHETILLVEDDNAVRNYLQTLLAGQGYTVVEAANGRQALAIMKAGSYTGIDLVLTDVVMPEMSGPELVSELAPLCPGLKVLFMSGYTDRELKGGSEYPLIQKPLSAPALFAQLREVLAKP
jgi:two-component system, cell cycle sensor histidine kinase and response regulator CckA